MLDWSKSVGHEGVLPSRMDSVNKIIIYLAEKELEQQLILSKKGK
jgi:hypothetical protein